MLFNPAYTRKPDFLLEINVYYWFYFYYIEVGKKYKKKYRFLTESIPTVRIYISLYYVDESIKNKTRALLTSPHPSAPEEKSIFIAIEKIKLDSIGILNTKLTLDEISIVMNRNIGWLKLIRNFQSYWIGNPIK